MYSKRSRPSRLVVAETLMTSLSLIRFLIVVRRPVTLRDSRDASIILALRLPIYIVIFLRCLIFDQLDVEIQRSHRLKDTGLFEH